jgi:hypothetical protein
VPCAEGESSTVKQLQKWLTELCSSATVCIFSFRRQDRIRDFSFAPLFFAQPVVPNDFPSKKAFWFIVASGFADGEEFWAA